MQVKEVNKQDVMEHHTWSGAQVAGGESPTPGSHILSSSSRGAEPSIINRYVILHIK